VSDTRLARREKASSRAVADDTLGASGAAVKPQKSIVTGGTPLHTMYVGRMMGAHRFFGKRSMCYLRDSRWRQAFLGSARVGFSVPGRTDLVRQP
jgi:hypothetical protein